jgi:hypothetical protein
MAASHDSPIFDVEKVNYTGRTSLSNESVHSFSWSDIAVTVKDRQTKRPLEILSDVCGFVKAGRWT